MKIEENIELKRYIIHHLTKLRSPDEIAGRLKKIGANQFEMRKSDFTPDKDLHVLILKRLPKS